MTHGARPKFRGLQCWPLLLACGFAGARLAAAANPTSYRVQFGPTGSDPMDATVAATSELTGLHDSGPVSPFGLILRARADVGRLKTVLESFGYYEASVTITIDGRPLTDPALAAALTAAPKNRDARVAVTFKPGPLYRIGRIDIDGAVPATARAALGLAPGQPAVAATVLAGGARMLSALEESGHAFAKVDPPVAYEQAHAPLLDLKFHVDAGPRVRIGEIRIVGLKRVHEAAVIKRLPLHAGESYAPSAIERARADLLNLGVFAAVTVRTGASVDARGRVPVTFTVRERPLHAVAVNAAYSSDLGGSGGVTWTNRNLFGNAEQLTLSALVTNIGGGATTGLGYDAGAKLLNPDFRRRDQSLQFAIDGVRQSLLAYQQRAITSGTTLNRRLSREWSVNAGVTTAHERIEQESVTRYYTLIAIPIGASYDSTNLRSPLDDPLHGVRGSVTVAPTRSIGATSATFVITQARFAAYLDLNQWNIAAPGRSVVALRALAGLAQGAGDYSLPPDQRFYGGGAGTIRGYRYQSVGPLFSDGNPIGGTAIVAGSIEFRQRFGRRFGVALFVDGGQVRGSVPPPTSVTTLPNLTTAPNALRVGVGAGLRYYTPIGPVRIDVAVPTRSYGPHQDRFEIYAGLGQAF